MVAAAVRLPLPVSALLVGVFALFHGYAHGAEMPGSASGLAYGLGFVAATGVCIFWESDPACSRNGLVWRGWFVTPAGRLPLAAFIFASRRDTKGLEKLKGKAWVPGIHAPGGISRVHQWLDFDSLLRLNCFHANNICWTAFKHPIPSAPFSSENSRSVANPTAQRGRRLGKRGCCQGQNFSCRPQ